MSGLYRGLGLYDGGGGGGGHGVDGKEHGHYYIVLGPPPPPNEPPFLVNHPPYNTATCKDIICTYIFICKGNTEH